MDQEPGNPSIERSSLPDTSILCSLSTKCPRTARTTFFAFHATTSAIGKRRNPRVLVQTCKTMLHQPRTTLMPTRTSLSPLDTPGEPPGRWIGNGAAHWDSRVLSRKNLTCDCCVDMIHTPKTLSRTQERPTVFLFGISAFPPPNTLTFSGAKHLPNCELPSKASTRQQPKPLSQCSKETMLILGLARPARDSITSAFGLVGAAFQHGSNRRRSQAAHSF